MYLAARGCCCDLEIAAAPSLDPQVFFFLKIYFYFMCISVCPHVCLCITCIHGTHRGQERAPEPLELELHIHKTKMVPSM